MRTSTIPVGRYHLSDCIQIYILMYLLIPFLRLYFVTLRLRAARFLRHRDDYNYRKIENKLGRDRSHLTVIF